MTRGGKRPGAGRPKGSRTRYEGPPLNCLVEAMEGFERGSPDAPLSARSAFALRLLGASPQEIAAVLQVSTDEMRLFSDQVDLGDAYRKCSLLHGLDQAAAGRNGKPSVACMIYLMRLFDRAATAPRSGVRRGGARRVNR